MAKSTAATVSEYLARLPPDRHALVGAIRKTVRQRLPKGYEEMLLWGVIAYAIPLSRLPDTYNGQPLCYAAIASNKSYVSLHLMSVYMNPPKLRALQEAFKKAGKKLDMGKGCLHFKRLDDVPLDVIGDAIASTPVDEYIAIFKASRRR
jgi:hypothetical protein